jgi:hypothetical protein
MSPKIKKDVGTCLFFDVTHTFSLPTITKDGIEIFNPKNENAHHKSHAAAYKRSNLGLRINSRAGENFLQIVNAFSDGIHFITEESLRSQYLIFGNGYPLSQAAGNGHKAMVELLLTNRADLTLRNQMGESALDIAAILGKPGIVRQLIAAGANVNAASSAQYDKTPLHHATLGDFR